MHVIFELMNVLSLPHVSATTWRPQTPRDSQHLMLMIKEIEECGNLPDAPPKPKLPDLSLHLSAENRIKRIQHYIQRFEYNHTGKNYFGIRKDQGLKKLVAICHQIKKECLPIKCIEATLLGAYLTLNMKDILRVPVRFQSGVLSLKFKHIVLAVRAGGKWGAIGLSRKSTLMDKNLNFESLSALLENYRDAYFEAGHEVHHIGIGLPFGRDEHSSAKIYWRPFMIKFKNQIVWDNKTNQAIDMFIDKHSFMDSYVTAHDGRLPEWIHSQFPQIRKTNKEKTSEDPASDSETEIEIPASPKRKSISNDLSQPLGCSARNAYY